MKILLLLITVSLPFSGCSLLYSISDDLPKNLNQWITEKKYKLALNTIDYVSPKHKAYNTIQKKKRLILKLVANYEKEGIKEATKLANKGNWIMAFEQLDVTSKNIPDTKNINEFRQQLLNRRNKLVSKYEHQLLAMQGMNLSEKYGLYEKIRKTLPEDEYWVLNVNEYDHLRHETSLKLLSHAQQEYKNGDFKTSLKSINLAYRLNPDENIISQLFKLKNRIHNKDRSKIRIRKVENLNINTSVMAIKLLLENLSKGYSHEILKEAKEKISWFKKNQTNSTKHTRLIARLEKKYMAGITHYFKSGRKLYSKGKIQEALIIWLELSALKPEYPQLQSHIIRAEKVLKKLDEISKKPAQTTEKQ